MANNTPYNETLRLGNDFDAIVGLSTKLNPLPSTPKTPAAGQTVTFFWSLSDQAPSTLAGGAIAGSGMILTGTEQVGMQTATEAFYTTLFAGADLMPALQQFIGQVIFMCAQSSTVYWETIAVLIAT